MSKNNIRSFRYSDEVAGILEGFKGSSMNEKFENLVLYCCRAVPEMQKRLNEMDKLLAQKRDELDKLRKKFGLVYEVMLNLESIKRHVDDLVKDIQKTEL